MLTVAQGRHKSGNAGRPIYSPFNILQQNEIFFRRGQLALVAAAPGTGKSAFVQSLVQRGDDKGHVNTSMYFSADSDSGTIYARSVSMATSWALSDVDKMIRDHDTQILDTHATPATRHIRWVFDSSPSTDEFMTQLEAYAMVNGAWPETITMDNLSNLYVAAEDTRTGLLGACSFLHDVARETDAAVIALHHVVGQYEAGNIPVPMSGLLEKVSKVPETILTLHRVGNKLNVSPVKNRTGKADASGSWVLPLSTDLSTMQIYG